MKKLLTVLLTVFMMFGLVACSNDANEPANEGSKIAKVGLGVATGLDAKSAEADKEGKFQADVTYAAVAFDAEGKIVSCDIDVAQNKLTFAADGTVAGEAIPTKAERKDDYNMRGSSEIKKEWFEQADAFEAWCVGKTVEQIKGAEWAVQGSGHGNSPVDLATSCTMTTDGDILTAIVKAEQNAKEAAGATEVKLASVTSLSPKSASADKDGQAQVNTTIALAATDAEGKIVAMEFDCAQMTLKGIKADGTVEFDAAKADTRTKAEKQGDYGMKDFSPIKKEWFEQVDAMEEFLTGKTLADFTGIQLVEKDGHNVAEGHDIYTACTMDLTSFVEAAKKLA